jgi:hypothetical protein
MRKHQQFALNVAVLSDCDLAGVARNIPDPRRPAQFCVLRQFAGSPTDQPLNEIVYVHAVN